MAFSHLPAVALLEIIGLKIKVRKMECKSPFYLIGSVMGVLRTLRFDYSWKEISSTLGHGLLEWQCVVYNHQRQKIHRTESRRGEA